MLVGSSSGLPSHVAPRGSVADFLQLCFLILAFLQITYSLSLVNIGTLGNFLHNFSVFGDVGWKYTVAFK